MSSVCRHVVCENCLEAVLQAGLQATVATTTELEASYIFFIIFSHMLQLAGYVLCQQAKVVHSVRTGKLRVVDVQKAVLSALIRLAIQDVDLSMWGLS